VVLREGHGKPILAVVPGPLEVDLKLLAKVVDEKNYSWRPSARQNKSLACFQAAFPRWLCSTEV
jgi:prolyl-tRNA editing enzyme YbaK/EbsC (Cys-tRNA(Pro) deacylase)